MGIIRILPPEEARKIAAGEVIDRPLALIREFIDNAIDSNPSIIEVSIEGGGSVKAEVSDDGRGMGPGDLELCYLPHATSKIRCLDDLGAAETLGFRGEALAAMAAVARLEIISREEGAEEAWRLDVGPGEAFPARIERAARTRGTTARAVELFRTIPARKRFLKRESSEGALCRQAFIEKALAFHQIAFRFENDGRAKDFFPRAATKKERFADALLEEGQKRFLHEIHVVGEGFSADVVIGGPELSRGDRRLLHVFANGRRIQDYSLLLALENGAQGWFPNGTHPVGALYLEIDPALADFNIHPAKREARFKDQAAIYRAISDTLKNFCRRAIPAHSFDDARNGSVGESLAQLALEPMLIDVERAHPHLQAIAFERRENALSDFAVAEKPPNYGEARSFDAERSLDEARYAGRVFGLFLLAERGNRLYIIDQHAAHERILYDRLMSGRVPSQELLVPIFFATESADDERFIEAERERLAQMSLTIAREGEGWKVSALPAGWTLDAGETVREILACEPGARASERWAMTYCCHKALRDGDYLDDGAAAALAREALALPDPRCPHGRPVWTEISREALFKAVRRT
ncbi:MAG: DNA mismatch repair endonuclease MutL [Treponema sp.]|nr:DNA mismatch repair endonuclease MutL [Treponema sp.]